MRTDSGHMPPVQTSASIARPKWGRDAPRTCRRCGFTAPSYAFPVNRAGGRKKLCQACVDSYFDPLQQRDRELQREQRYRREVAQRQGKKYRSRAEIRQQVAQRELELLSARETTVLHDGHVRAWRSDEARVWRWRYRHDAAFREQQRARIRDRKARMLCWRIGGLVREAVKRDGDSRTVRVLVGWTIEDFKRSFESQFTQGMSWAAFAAGEIHIDHRVPSSAFDLSTVRGTRAAWALENIRPMWREDNLRRKLGPLKISRVLQKGAPPTGAEQAAHRQG